MDHDADRPSASEDEHAPRRRPAWLRRLPVAAIAVVAVVLIALVAVVVAVAHHPTAEGVSSAATTTSAPERRTGTTAPPPSVAATTAPPVSGGKGTVPPPLTDAQKAAQQAQLTAEAARLTRPLSLTSPTDWDQYLPAGKPYPGADADADMATCPRLASSLTQALGKKMSYWTGTLPEGPYGCSWVPVPLSYDGPYTYAYQLNVGYLADGTTTEQLRTGFYENGPETCPGVDVPAVGPGAVLVRCDGDTGIEFSLVLRDTRRAGGVWLLHATARADAPHTAPEALDALIAAIRPVYG